LLVAVQSFAIVAADQGDQDGDLGRVRPDDWDEL
jgi:hypothetical protein